MNISDDTIVAIATPQGRGSIGVLRISGNLCKNVAYHILGKVPYPRYAEYISFLDNDGYSLDQGIAIFFQRPKSFTGEDVLELHGHGNPIILNLLLQRVLSVPGIRIARPGEFSERAFLNNKLDLIQAEAIADLIDAGSLQAVRSAVHSLKGQFSKLIYELLETLTNLRIYIEASIDFTDDEIEFISTKKIEDILNEILEKFNQIYCEADKSSLLREGIKVVIAGKPNSGKSSLMNALVGNEISIVTKVAGTTRDIVRESIYIDGIQLFLIDTAGLHDTTNEVECIGIERAWSEIKEADHVLFVIDSNRMSFNENDDLFKDIISKISKNTQITVIRNKADISGEKIEHLKLNKYNIITLSALSRDGINLLLDHIKFNIIEKNSTETKFLARLRHLEALKITKKHLIKCKKYLEMKYSIELLSEELRLAQHYLSEITGKFKSEDLLNKIFSTFCIGK